MKALMRTVPTAIGYSVMTMAEMCGWLCSLYQLWLAVPYLMRDQWLKWL